LSILKRWMDLLLLLLYYLLWNDDLRLKDWGLIPQLLKQDFTLLLCHLSKVFKLSNRIINFSLCFLECLH
jgi:hypothetical protein